MCPEGHYDCGEYRNRTGPPPNGWIQIRRVREDPVWYCGPDCVIRALGISVSTAPVNTNDDDEEDAPPSLAELLRLLGASIGRPINLMNATPTRVRAALDELFARVVDHVQTQAEQDARGRPTTAALLAEAAGIRTMDCSGCGLLKPVDQFPASFVRRGNGRCRACMTRSEAERKERERVAHLTARTG